MYIGLHETRQLFLSDFNGNWNFLARVLKKYADIKFHENPPKEGAEFFHADSRTDTTKFIVASRSSSNAPKNILKVYMCGKDSKKKGLN